MLDRYMRRVKTSSQDWDAVFENRRGSSKSLILFQNNHLPSDFNVEVKIKDRHQLHKYLSLH